MEPRPVPQSAHEENPDGQIVTVGRPVDSFPDECGDASMFFEYIEFSGRVVPYFSSYYQPTREDLELLQQGGMVRINFVGHVVPHSCRVVK